MQVQRAQKAQMCRFKSVHCINMEMVPSVSEYDVLESQGVGFPYLHVGGSGFIHLIMTHLIAAVVNICRRYF